ADFPEITLYPNPAISNITITGVDNFSSLKIYNQAGQQLKYFTIKGESVTVTLTSMPTGVYIAELGNGSKTTTITFLKK
ncbi:MAG TPA: T9SS type A sorting domain-containing protein, partial [Hanamia sp.]